MSNKTIPSRLSTTKWTLLCSLNGSTSAILHSLLLPIPRRTVKFPDAFYLFYLGLLC